MRQRQQEGGGRCQCAFAWSAWLGGLLLRAVSAPRARARARRCGTEEHTHTHAQRSSQSATQRSRRKRARARAGPARQLVVCSACSLLAGLLGAACLLQRIGLPRVLHLHSSPLLAPLGPLSPCAHPSSVHGKSSEERERQRERVALAIWTLVVDTEALVRRCCWRDSRHPSIKVSRPGRANNAPRRTQTSSARQPWHPCLLSREQQSQCALCGANDPIKRKQAKSRCVEPAASILGSSLERRTHICSPWSRQRQCAPLHQRFCCCSLFLSTTTPDSLSCIVSMSALTLSARLMKA